MAYIRVNCGFLDSAVRKLEQNIVRIEELQRQLDEAIGDAAEGWDGEDAEEFERITKQRMESENIKQILKGLKNQKKRLMDSAKLYRNAQSDAQRQARWL